MSRLICIAAWAVVIGAGLWLFGGLLLRAGGALSLAARLLIAASTGLLAAAVIAALGGIAWLCGHWLFAVRNHYYRSPLARRVFLTAMPRGFDPTSRWGLPTIHPRTADEPRDRPRIKRNALRRERTASAAVTPPARHG
jgi:hypothetical protein